MSVPRFDELPIRSGAPAGATWGVFGDSDELGTLNFAGAAQTRAAAGLVRRGAVFALNLDINLPDPALFGRSTTTHAITHRRGVRAVAVDDHLDSFFPQASSQWDALRHFGVPEGFYNGVDLDQVLVPAGGVLGIDRIGRRGIATRGVLLDVPRALASRGISFDPLEFFPIDTTIIETVLEVQNESLHEGDVVLVRTGWLEAYLGLDADARTAIAQSPPATPGLFGPELAAMLWDHRVAAIAADNPALEAFSPTAPPGAPLHEALLAGLGMPLGELWQLGALAADCAADGVYEAMLTSAPLIIPGGSGSPPNALAIK